MNGTIMSIDKQSMPCLYENGTIMSIDKQSMPSRATSNQHHNKEAYYNSTNTTNSHITNNHITNNQQSQHQQPTITTNNTNQ